MIGYTDKEGNPVFLEALVEVKGEKYLVIGIQWGGTLLCSPFEGGTPVPFPPSEVTVLESIPWQVLCLKTDEELLALLETAKNDSDILMITKVRRSKKSLKQVEAATEDIDLDLL